MNVDIRDVVEYTTWRAGVNRADLSDITFFDNGVEVEVTEADIKEWRFTGMNNIDFVMLRLLGDQHD